MSRNPPYFLKAKDRITTEMVDWLYDNVGGEGAGWRRNGHNMVALFDRMRAIQLISNFSELTHIP